MPTRKNKDITRIVNRVNKSNADFVNRLKDPNRLTIPDWEDSRYIATHKLGVGTDNNGQIFIYPSVQNINGKLIDFTNPKFGKWDGMDSAIERNDTVHVDSIQDGLDFTENYKRYYPTGKTFKCGGRRKAQLGLDIREGGIAIPIAPNMYYMDGRSHDNGGIAIGPNNKNGLEVEGGEVVKVGNNDIKVFSSVPLLRGVSPAQLVMGGANPNKVFKAQEEFKDRNRINDDGTIYEIGGEKRIYELSDIQKNQYARTGKLNITGYPITPLTKGYNTLRALSRFRTTFKKSLSTGEAINNTVKGWINDVTKNTKQNPSKTASLIKSVYNSFIGKRQENLGLLHENTEDRVIKKKFGGQDDTKTAALKKLKAKHTIKGVYGGGESGGAGAGSVVMETPEYVTDTITKRYLVPVTQNFNDAFGDAVNAGLDKFMFDKKWYTTEKGNNPNNNAAGAAKTQTVYLPVEHKEVRRRKKEFGGSMIYTINGNIKNGLSLRPKAKMGKEEKIDNKTKIGEDGLIYKRGTDGNWYTDGTVHASRRKITSNKNIKQHSSKSSTPTTLKKVNFTSPLIQGERKKIGNLYYEQTEDGQWKPTANQSSVTTRDSGRPVDFGMTRIGINHPNGKYTYHPLTGEKINADGTIETEEPSVKSVTKVSSKESTSSTPRRGESKSAVTTKSKTEPAYINYKPSKVNLSVEADNPTSITLTKIDTPSTGGGTKSKDGRWVGQYKTTNVGDWIGLGSNLAGSVASYFMTKSAIDKMPEPLKPVMTPTVKLKTKYNIEPQLTNINEAEQINRASVRRNTQSSNTSLAREQRLMNEARGARNTLYGQKENIETQLINQDRLNRQSVMRDSVKAYNEYLNKLTATKTAQNQLKVSNINNLISGLTGSVNSILGNIESRRATNNTLRAIAAANPNVDARLIGGFDYYIDPITKKKYNKNQQYVGTING